MAEWLGPLTVDLLLPILVKSWDRTAVPADFFLSFFFSSRSITSIDVLLSIRLRPLNTPCAPAWTRNNPRPFLA